MLLMPLPLPPPLLPQGVGLARISKCPSTSTPSSPRSSRIDTTPFGEGRALCARLQRMAQRA